MTTFKITAFYQDPTINSLGFVQGYKLDRAAAVEVGTYEVKADVVDVALDIVFTKLNMLNIPVGHPMRPLFEKALHTSMSVGDFCTIEGHEGIYLCINEGWSHVVGAELEQMEGAAK